MTPTETFVSESRKICEAATTGPWDTEHKFDSPRPANNPGWYELNAPLPDGLNPNYGEYSIADSMNRHHCVSPDEDAANFAFFAHARTALPQALDIIEQQAGEIDVLLGIRDTLAKRIAELEAKVSRWESKHREDMSYHGGDHSSKAVRVGGNESLILQEPNP